MPVIEKPQTESNGRKLKNYKKWQEVVRRVSPTEALFAPFLQAAYAYESTDGKFYIYFESKFAVTLLTDIRKKTLCAAINTAGGSSYLHTDIIGTVREDTSEFREPMDDLLALDEVEITNEK